jgi:hypothetical protein
MSDDMSLLQELDDLEEASQKHKIPKAMLSKMKKKIMLKYLKHLSPGGAGVKSAKDDDNQASFKWNTIYEDKKSQSLQEAKVYLTKIFKGEWGSDPNTRGGVSSGKPWRRHLCKVDNMIYYGRIVETEKCYLIQQGTKLGGRKVMAAKADNDDDEGDGEESDDDADDEEGPGADDEEGEDEEGEEKEEEEQEEPPLSKKAKAVPVSKDIGKRAAPPPPKAAEKSESRPKRGKK